MGIVRRRPRKKITKTDLPYIGKLTAPVLMIVDPVVGNTSATMPLNKTQMRWFTQHVKENGQFDTKDVCVISCAPPVSQETWEQGRLVSAHLKEHREHLLKLIERNKPKFILPFGAKAAQQVIGRAVQITKVRGQAFQEPDIAGGVPVLPMLSPFFAQRQPENEAAFRADMQTASRIYLAGYDIDASAIDYKHKYEWCWDVKRLSSILRRNNRFSVDVESVGLQGFNPDTAVMTIQITWKAGRSVMVPINYDRGKWRHHNFIPWDDIDRRGLLRVIKQAFEDPRKEILGQNFKFDWLMLWYQLGIEVANYADDTMLLAHLLDENQRRLNIDDLVRQHVPSMAGFNDAYNNDPDHHGKSRMDLLPPDKLLPYGCGDTDAAWRLEAVLKEKVLQDKGKKASLIDTYNHVTMPAQRAFCHIELNGFPVSRSELVSFENKLHMIQKRERIWLLKQIPKSIKDKWKDSGVGLKVTRAVILRDWLYKHKDGLKLKPVLYTKTKEPSISSKQVLPYYAADHPVIARLIDYIKNDKLLNTYAKGFHKYIFDGLIRPTYKLTSTVTGRSACVHADTPIYTDRGLVRIADIQIGDRVLTHRNRMRRVSQRFIKPTQDMYTVKLSDDSSIDCTEEHRFLTPDGMWKSLRTVCVQTALGRYPRKTESHKSLHEILCPEIADDPKSWKQVFDNCDGRIAYLCSYGAPTGETAQDVVIEEIHYRGSYPVYDIEVEEDHSYAACGVFNHNSADPNGQNFPKRGKLAKEYRKVFQAPKGWTYCSLDLSQAELRIVAMLSGDEHMLSVYASGGDIHRATAAGVMGVSVDKFLKLPADEQGLKRFNAKAVNFGFIYGMWWVSFRRYAKTDYGIDFTDDEAREIREMFFETYPRLEEWHEAVQEYVYKKGYIRTFDGRIRHLPNVYSDDEGIAKQAMRQGINAPVQSIASDLGLMALGQMVPYLREKGYDEWLKPCGFIHDAIVCLVREDKVAHAMQIVKHRMENLPLKEWFDWEPEIPIIADAEVGTSLATTYEIPAKYFMGKKNRNKSYIDLVRDVDPEAAAALEIASSSTIVGKKRKLKIRKRRGIASHAQRQTSEGTQKRRRRIRKSQEPSAGRNKRRKSRKDNSA